MFHILLLLAEHSMGSPEARSVVSSVLARAHKAQINGGRHAARYLVNHQEAEAPKRVRLDDVYTCVYTQSCYGDSIDNGCWEVGQ